MVILSKGELKAVTVSGRIDLGMDNPYVLVSSQSLVVGWQSSEKPLHKVRIQSNVSVMKAEDYRPIRMIGPSFGIENVEEIVGGIKVRNDVRHI